MGDEQIEAVRTWSEPKLVKDNHVFIWFANFYQRFIQDFGKIAAPLTLMLRASLQIRSLENSTPSVNVVEDDEVGDVGVGGSEGLN